MGTSLQVDSTTNSGTRFSFTVSLPLA